MRTGRALRYGLLTTIVIFALAAAAWAQPPVGWSSFQLRYGIDQRFVTKPATCEFVVPTGSDQHSTVIVNAAAMMTAFGTSRLTLDLVGEYGRNTAIDKEQDTWRSGLSCDWKPFGTDLIPVVLGNALLKEDRVHRTSALQGGLQVTATGNNRTGCPNTTIVLKEGKLTFVYSPYLGVEIERTLSKGTEATFVRGIGRLDATLRWGKPTAPLWEIFSTNAVRQDWQDSSVPGDRQTSDHSAGFNWNLLRGEGRATGGLTVAYNWGANPSLGLSQHSYFEFSIALRVAPKAK